MIQNSWYTPDERKPVTGLGYETIITIDTVGNTHDWDIESWLTAWHEGDGQARHTYLWTYKPFN